MASSISAAAKASAAFSHKVLGYGPTSRLSEAHFLPRWFSSVASNGSRMQKSQVLGYGPTSRLIEAHFLPRWFSSVASNGSPMQKSQVLGYGSTSRLSEAHFLPRWFSSVASNGPPMQKSQVLGYGPTSRLSEAHFLPRWFSSVASNGSPMQKSQIPETNKSGAELKQSDARKSSGGATPKVVVFSPLEAVIAKPRGSPLTNESSKVRRSEIATQVTFYMIPALLLVSKNSISTSLLVGAVFHQVYMFHKEIFLDYVHHDITRKWSLIYFKLLLLVMAKDTIMYFNLF